MKNIKLIFLIILTSCVSFDDILYDEKVFFLSGYENVKVIDQDSNISGPNIHPVSIEPERIEGAFQQFIIRIGTKTIPLFPGEKINFVSESISKALKGAKTNEDVVFTIENWYKGLPGTRLSDNRVVSGRIFYNRDGLNIIFGSVLREGFQSTTDPMLRSKNPDLRQNPYLPGSRKITVKSPYPLAAPPDSGIVRPAISKGRGDWVVLTPKSLSPRSALTENERRTATSSNIEVQGLRNELQQLRQELQTLKKPTQQLPYGYYQYGNTPQYQNYPSPYQVPNQQNPYYNQNLYQIPNQYNPAQQQYYPNQQQNYQNNMGLKSLENMRQRGLISEENYLKKLKELGF